MCEVLSKVAEVLGVDFTELKVYLLGKVAVLAKSREDVMEAFRAVSEPPYVPFDYVRRLQMRGFRPITLNRGNVVQIHVPDIPDLETALALANRIMSEFASEAPFYLQRVDVVISFRSSEDGGVAHRYSVDVVIDARRPDLVRRCCEFIEKLGKRDAST